jgi:hypothetical protein
LLIYLLHGRHFYIPKEQNGKNYLMSSGHRTPVLPLQPRVPALKGWTTGANDMKKMWAAVAFVVALTTVDLGAAQRRTEEWREVTIPAGTILKVNLNTGVGSDTSKTEDPVRGTLRSPVIIRGVTALPAGTALNGYVTDAVRSARVKGRARVALRFTRIDPPGPDDSATIRTATVSRIAPGTKKRDAAKIGGGAVGGAIVGGIVGGADGAAKGAAIGGASGTGVVLATRGKEVRIAAGTPLLVRLSQALTVRVPAR